MTDLRLGQRVFHRRADGFGTVKALRTKDGQNLAAVQYEWPWDPKADPFEVPCSELVDEYDAPLAPRRPPTLAERLIDAAGLGADIEEGRDPVEAMVDLRRSYNSAQDEAIRLRELKARRSAGTTETPEPDLCECECGIAFTPLMCPGCELVQPGLRIVPAAEVGKAEAERIRERIRKALDYATVGGVIGANVIEEALRG